MNKYISFFFLIVLLSGCKDDPSIMEIIDDFVVEEGLNVTTTASGLRYEILEPGEGDLPVANSLLTLNFKGMRTDGTVFGQDSVPFLAYITTQIPGLAEGLRLMPKNSKAIFVMPPDLAFGDTNAPNIPPNSVVVYEIEVFDINNSIQEEILQYIDDNTLTAVETNDGLFHVIHEPGEASKPSVNSTVEVNYSGRLTNGTVFDETTGEPARLGLSNVIRGWQLGVPLIGKGGSVTLIIPPQLGYGFTPQGDDIPENSVLVFDIELVDF